MVASAFSYTNDIAGFSSSEPTSSDDGWRVYICKTRAPRLISEIWIIFYTNYSNSLTLSLAPMVVALIDCQLLYELAWSNKKMVPLRFVERIRHTTHDTLRFHHHTLSSASSSLSCRKSTTLNQRTRIESKWTRADERGWKKCGTNSNKRCTRATRRPLLWQMS